MMMMMNASIGIDGWGEYAEYTHTRSLPMSAASTSEGSLTGWISSGERVRLVVLMMMMD